MVHAACWAGMAATAWAESTDLNLFEWRSRINGEITSNMLHKARLSAEAMRRMQSFPLDARIVDEHGVTWPSMVWTRMEPEMVTPVHKEPAGIMTTDDSSGAHVRTFRVKGNPGRHNRVIVVLKGKEFTRRCEVWGGDHPNRLRRLGSDLLVERNSPDVVRHRIIDYPESTASVVQVRVFKDQRETGHQSPVWQATELALVKKNAGTESEMELEMLDPPADQSAGAPGVSVVYLHAPLRSIPLLHLHVQSNLRNEMVAVRIYGRSEEGSSWRKISGGVIGGYDGVRRDIVDMRQMDYPFLKLELMHGDTEPPRVREVRATVFPHYVVFRPISSAQAHMYLGSSRYQLPSVGFIRGVDGPGVEAAREVELSRVHANPARMVGSLDAYWKTILNLLLFMVIATLLMMGARLIKMRYLD